MATSQTERFNLTIEDDDEFCSILKTAENFRKLDEKAESVENKVTEAKSEYTDDEYLSANATLSLLQVLRTAIAFEIMGNKNQSGTLSISSSSSPKRVTGMTGISSTMRALKVHVAERNTGAYAEMIYHKATGTVKLIYKSADFSASIEPDEDEDGIDLIFSTTSSTSQRYDFSIRELI